MKFGESFFNKPKQEKKYEKILPEDVRYALSYNKAHLNKNLIEILNTNHFSPEATYLITKALEFNNQQRFNYLNELIEKYTLENSEQDIVDINKKYLSTLDVSQEVDAMKLGQLSRQGFNYWQEMYEDFAKKVSQSTKTPILIANAPILGIKHFVKEFTLAKKDFGIIFPKSINNNSDLEAYKYTFGENSYSASIFDQNNIFPENLVCIDDVKNTGETENMLKNYFTENHPDCTVSYDSVSQTKNPS